MTFVFHSNSLLWREINNTRRTNSIMSEAKIAQFILGAALLALVGFAIFASFYVGKNKDEGFKDVMRVWFGDLGILIFLLIFVAVIVALVYSPKLKRRIDKLEDLLKETLTNVIKVSKTFEQAGTNLQKSANISTLLQQGAEKLGSSGALSNILGRIATPPVQ
jgi:hypothetical protein